MVWGSGNDLRKEMVNLIHERRTFELPFVSLDPQYANLPARSQVAILQRSLHDARKQAPIAEIDSPTLPGATKQVLLSGEDNTANTSRIRRQGRR
jgi:hypothetical protein